MLDGNERRGVKTRTRFGLQCNLGRVILLRLRSACKKKKIDIEDDLFCIPYPDRATYFVSL